VLGKASVETALEDATELQLGERRRSPSLLTQVQIFLFFFFFDPQIGRGQSITEQVAQDF